MLFNEAFKALTEGKYVTRRAWSETNEYLVIMPMMTTIFKVLNKPNPNVGNWLPFVSDYLAEDWILLDDLIAEQKAKISPEEVLPDAA